MAVESKSIGFNVFDKLDRGKFFAGEFCASKFFASKITAEFIHCRNIFLAIGINII